MNTVAIYEFSGLLNLFSQLPRAKQQPKTLLEISGYPHFENVASNILEFFFCPSEAHGLRGLVLGALLSLVNDECDFDLRADVKIEREVLTKTGKRLDIVAHNSNLTIGIENKISAPVYNDLQDYSDYLEEKARSTGNHPIKIILCLKKEALETDHGFKVISYEEFSERLLNRIGEGILDADPRYLGLLLDFVNTMKNLKSGTHMDAAVVEFFKRNPKTVELYRQAEIMLDELRQKTKELRRGMKRLPSEIRGPIPYDKIDEECENFHSTVYCEADVADGLRLVLEVTVQRKEEEEKDGWRIYVFPRRGTPQQVNDWLKKKKIFSLGRPHVEEWVFKEFPFAETVETVRIKYEQLLDLVYKSL